MIYYKFVIAPILRALFPYILGLILAIIFRKIIIKLLITVIVFIIPTTYLKVRFIIFYIKLLLKFNKLDLL